MAREGAEADDDESEELGAAEAADKLPTREDVEAAVVGELAGCEGVCV